MKKSGFSVVEAIIVAAVVVLVALVGWYVWQKNHSVSKSTSTTNGGSAQPASPSSGTQAVFLTDQEKTTVPASWQIPDWHVNAKNASSLTLQYKMNDDKKQTSFISAELAASNKNCNIFKQLGEYQSQFEIVRYGANDDTGGAGITVKGTSARDLAAFFDANGYKDRYKQVGDYYYVLITPQESCGFNGGVSESETTATLETKTEQAVKDLLASFVVAD